MGDPVLALFCPSGELRQERERETERTRKKDGGQAVEIVERGR